MELVIHMLMLIMYVLYANDGHGRLSNQELLNSSKYNIA